MTILDRISDARRVWSLLIPHVEPPGDIWLARWCAAYTDAAIEHAITKTAKKFRDPNRVESQELTHRYCSSVLKNHAIGVDSGTVAA
jgi:hypothetical protein